MSSSMMKININNNEFEYNDLTLTNITPITNSGSISINSYTDELSISSNIINLGKQCILCLHIYGTIDKDVLNNIDYYLIEVEPSGNHRLRIPIATAIESSVTNVDVECFILLNQLYMKVFAVIEVDKETNIAGNVNLQCDYFIV